MFLTKLMYGLEVTAVGLIVVFFGLFILIVLIKAMTALFEKFKKPESAAEAKPAVVPASAPVAVAAPVEEEPVTDDSEVVAAIMAALSCVYEGTGKRPVVRSVRRSSGNWKNAYR